MTDSARVVSIGIAIVFLMAISVLAMRGTLPTAIPGVYLAASSAAFIAYRIDKSAAETGAWRIAESTLHVLALLGGWPGALIAQQVFHHKSRKLSFRIVFWTTVALNCAALFWFYR